MQLKGQLCKNWKAVPLRKQLKAKIKPKHKQINLKEAQKTQKINSQALN